MSPVSEMIRGFFYFSIIINSVDMVVQKCKVATVLENRDGSFFYFTRRLTCLHTGNFCLP